MGQSLHQPEHGAYPAGRATHAIPAARAHARGRSGRSGHLRPRPPLGPMFPLTKPQAWRQQRTKLRQERYDENKLNRVEQVGGYFTAATGGTMYDGDVFPKQYWGNIFTGDVSANLVHRDIINAKASTSSPTAAKRARNFSPPMTSGSGPAISRSVRTAICTSPISTASSLKRRNPFLKSSGRLWISGAVWTRAEFTA